MKRRFSHWKFLSGALLGIAPTLALAGDVFTQKPVIQEAVSKTEDGALTTVPAASGEKPDVSGGPDTFWIWNEGKTAQSCFLRKEFETDAKSGALIATCDNGMTVRLNGQPVASSSEWNAPVTVDVTKHLKSGKNLITVDATNEGAVGGFALKLALTKADKSREYIVSDSTWTIAKDRDFTDFYQVKTIGKMGVTPWNDVFSNPGGGDHSLLKGAVPRGVFQVPAGFQVEELYTVPKETQGSWVSIAFDNKGRLIASDQGDKGLYRITPPTPGSDEPTKVEALDIGITSAQGMLWAFDALYVSVNGGPGSGLYRVTDTSNDDQFDKVEKLADIRGGGEHGPHALRLSPDGKSIYLIAGNHTDPPQNLTSSRIRTNWSEDLLLPRQWDARGHARGKLAPGGWVAKTDPEGKTWEMVSIGYRNPYDFDFTPEGELFAYDADMEWDMGSPWYRPTRICHVVSGSEFGWRSGTGKWPTWNVDSLPQVVDIGPGSPVGVAFGTGAKFPAKYQQALYCCDWTFGTMYAVHLVPQGASYVGVKEEFVARTPLPLTDVAIGPDGAMYFSVGGRGTESALFRVTYVGDESTAPVQKQSDEFSALRVLRRELETLHVEGQSSEANVQKIWKSLGHADRHIRYAARTALEFQDPELWEKRVPLEKDPETLITGIVALARQGNPALRDNALERLLQLPFASLSENQKLEWLRTVGLVFIRMGEPTPAQQKTVAEFLDPYYPAKGAALNRELVQVLVYVNSPTVIAKTLPMLAADFKQVEVTIPDVLTRNGGYGSTVAQMLVNMPNLDQANFVFSLRNMKFGWSLEQRKQYLEWFKDASKKSGGASYQGFLDNIRADFLANATETERKALEGTLAQTVIKADELPKPAGPGQEWTMAGLLTSIQSGQLSGRNFENGKRAFSAARCITCHRYLGEGGSTGPDLTNVAGRFSYRDLLESTIEPSKVISDQYRAAVIQTVQGKVITGRILSEADGKVLILTDPVDATKIVEINKTDIDELTPSPVSLMPAKLFDPLNRDELLDLLGYLMSRGNPNDPVFAR